MDQFIARIENLSVEESLPFLSSFIEDNEKGFCSPYLDAKVRQRFWTSLFNNLEDSEHSAKLLCLKAMRILSREKLNLSTFITNERLFKLFNQLQLKVDSRVNDDCSLEALKCLCNLTYNLPAAADSLHSFDATLLLANRLHLIKDEVFERKLSEIKLLFLMTAFSNSSREVLYQQYGLNLFIELCMREGNISNEAIVGSSSKKHQISANQIKLLCDVLKTLFTVLINVKIDQSENTNQFEKFVCLSRELILVGLSPQTVNLISDIVNVLISAPNHCLTLLMIPGKQVNEKMFIEKSPAMEAVLVLIEFLDYILTKLEEVSGTSKEELSPIVLLLKNMSMTNALYRKYIRSKVLPNLRDVYTRPEVGNTLRNKLCRLLTCPITSTRDLVADFLFVLCKESVTRMVKYTGYGNAAGLLANRGLLGSGQHSNSESEHSETEEYTQNKHMINPVVGCLTPPRVNEIANMTEEQKEFLALELVNQLDKLQRDGIFKPCRVGPDGKPTPVENVLELQESGLLETSKKK